MKTKLLFVLLVIVIQYGAVAVPLSGSYTIGGASPNYVTISAAISALDSNGINAPVVFNIRNGNYPELLVFSAVTGASAINTITFQSEGGDSSLVEINGATTANQQNTVRLNQIDYFTLKSITIKQNPNVNNNAVMFISRGKYCTISNCVLWGYQSGTSSATEYTIQGNNDSNLVVRNSYLGGSVSGCYFGNSFFSHRNLLIENCNVATKLFIDAGAFATVKNCDVGGRLLLQQTSRCSIYNNYLRNMLQSISSSGWPLQKMKIYNNIIFGGTYQGTVAYGFWASSSGYYDFCNNTIYMDTPTMTGYALNTDVYSGGIKIQNNIIFRNDTNSANYIFRYSGVESYPGYIISDHNLFFRNGTSFSNNYASLAAFTTGTGLDSNSVYANPQFTSSTNFYTTSTSVDNIGVPISYITTDVLGNARSTFSPTVGAYENMLVTSFSYNFQEDVFGLYPNPTKDILNVDLSSKYKVQNIKLAVVDILGNYVLEEVVSTEHSTINIQHLKYGIYFIKISTPINVFTQKIIKY